MFVCINKKENTSLSGEYLLFKSRNNTYLILSLKRAGKTYKPETFICNDGLKYYDANNVFNITSVELAASNI